MNILVIGNGFDLAHGLPTKYTDFLDWIIDGYYWFIKDRWMRFYFYHIIGMYNDDKYDAYNQYDKYHLHIFPKKNDKKKIWFNIHSRELKSYIDRNLWIEYFCYRKKYLKNNWIDFEKEIGNVIQSLEKDLQKISTRKNIRNTFIKKRLKIRLKSKKESYIRNCTSIYEKIIEILYYDLNRLVRALEIYLKEVEELKIVCLSPDIINIKFDKVLNFNYTSIYEQIYGKGKDIEYDYIHGKAGIENTIDSNNMVLGMDEYLPNDRKDKDIAFIKFKKFYQRIYKQTGSEYKKWIYEIKAEWSRLNKEEKEKITYQISQNYLKNEKIHKIFIFGHSLDITDKDVLKDLILNDNVYTTIFYHSKEVMGQQIANLVKVIGQDELIKRTGGSTKTIEFKLQQPMVPIDSVN